MINPTINPLDKAADQLIDHTTQVEADGIFDFVVHGSTHDENGALWFHIRGHSNTDGEICRDDNLYEVQPSGVIRAYSPKDRPDNERAEYWNVDWGCNPIDYLYFATGRRWLLGSYFDKPQIEARFNKSTGELTSRYFQQFIPNKRVAVRALWAQFDNPFRCTIAGNPEQYDRDTAALYD